MLSNTFIASYCCTKPQQ